MGHVSPVRRKSSTAQEGSPKNPTMMAPRSRTRARCFSVMWGAQSARSLWCLGRLLQLPLLPATWAVSFIQVWSWGSHRESASKTEVMVGNLIMDLTSPSGFSIESIRINLLSTRRFWKTECQETGIPGPVSEAVDYTPGSWEAHKTFQLFPALWSWWPWQFLSAR